MRTCKTCGSEKPLEMFPMESGYRRHSCQECYAKRSREKSANYYARNRNARMEQMRVLYIEHKIGVLNHYGDRCSCCGETQPLFLTIDHIDNDGAAHRRKVGNSSHNNIYGWLVRNKYPAGFQVLCMNCNQGKHRNGGICPHVKKVQRSGQ